MVETSVPAMETGDIDWEVMKTLGDHHTVAPQTTLSLNITSPKIYHFIVMHYDKDSADEPVMEVRIINDYGDDKMGQAMFLSLPSLWMTGFVVYRLYRLKKKVAAGLILHPHMYGPHHRQQTKRREAWFSNQFKPLLSNSLSPRVVKFLRP